MIGILVDNQKLYLSTCVCTYFLYYIQSHFEICVLILAYNNSEINTLNILDRQYINFINDYTLKLI